MCIRDSYTVFARTSDEGGRGLSCFLVPAESPGLSFGAPERTMGLNGDTVGEVILDDVEVSAERRIGAEGAGMSLALAALDAGRLGIAAAATGLAPVSYTHLDVYKRQPMRPPGFSAGSRAPPRGTT